MNQNQLLFGACIASLVAGLIVALVHFDVVRIEICLFPTQQATLGTAPAALHKTIKVITWRAEQFEEQPLTIVWQQNNMAESLKTITRHWLTLLQEQHPTLNGVHVAWVTASAAGHEACINFSAPLLLTSWSIRDKWAVIESLLRTLQALELPLQQVWLLVQGAPLQDEHIACLQPYATTPLLRS